MDGTIAVKGGGAEAWEAFLAEHPQAEAEDLVAGALASFRQGEWSPEAGAARRRFAGPQGPAVGDWAAWDGSIGAYAEMGIAEETRLELRHLLMAEGSLRGVGYSDFVAGAVRALQEGLWSLDGRAER